MRCGSGISICSPLRASASLRNEIVSVKKPSSSMAMVPPMISGRCSWSMSIGWSMKCRNRSGSLSRPWMTCTKPASSDPPSRNICALSQSWNMTSPSKHCCILLNHSPCSGLVEFLAAASRLSKRTTPTNSLSSVMP